MMFPEDLQLEEVQKSLRQRARHLKSIKGTPNLCPGGFKVKRGLCLKGYLLPNEKISKTSF